MTSRGSQPSTLTPTDPEDSRISAQQPRAAALAVRTTFLLVFLAASAAAEPVWVLQSARTNPKDEPKRFDAGITPGYYSPRFAGSFEEIVVTEEQLGVKQKWVDRERVDFDVELTANMKPPKNTLKPGDTIPIEVRFAKSGSVQSGNPGIVFRFAASDGTLTGPREVGYFPFAPDYAGPTTAVWNLTVPAAGDGEFTIDASLNNHGAAWVRWTYRIEEMTEGQRTGTGVGSVSRLQADKFFTIGWVRGVFGEVYIERGGKRIKVERNGMPIMTGDIVSTLRKGLVSIELDDKDPTRPGVGPSIINIASNSKMWMESFRVFVDEAHGERSREGIFGLINGKIRAFTKGWGRTSSFSVKAGVSICGIRGSDVFISHDPDTKEVNAYVIEGHMDVTNSKTRDTKSLTDNQMLAVTNGSIGEIQPLNQAEWDSLVKENGLENMQPMSQDNPYDIPELSANVTGLRVYEGPDAFIALDARVYRTRFPRAEVRYLWWQLDLAYSMREREASFALKGIFYNPDGSVRAEMPLDGRLKAGWSSSQHSSGWGYNEPGQWPPGRYRLEVRMNDRKVAETSIEVEP